MGLQRAMQILVSETNSCIRRRLNLQRLKYTQKESISLLIVFNFFYLVNTDNKVGAIGFVSRIIPAVYPISIIRVDPENGEPIRNAKGLCIPCKPGECIKYKF